MKWLKEVEENKRIKELELDEKRISNNIVPKSKLRMKKLQMSSVKDLFNELKPGQDIKYKELQINSQREDTLSSNNSLHSEKQKHNVTCKEVYISGK